MRIALLTILTVFAVTPSMLAQESHSQTAPQTVANAKAGVPKDWRVIQEKHGCVFAIPRGWQSQGVNFFGSTNREILMMVSVRPLVTSMATYKTNIAKNGEKILDESDRKIWSSQGMSVDRALGYRVRQELMDGKTVCSVYIRIDRSIDVPAHGEEAKKIAQSIHAE